jgi:transcriptional regulator with XRE-family HTH domain
MGDSIDDLKDHYLGKTGSPERDRYENQLQMDVLGHWIRFVRKEQGITQEELGKRLGVQKAQISKLETGSNSTTVDTIVRVFQALNAEIRFQVLVGGKAVTPKPHPRPLSEGEGSLGA